MIDTAEQTIHKVSKPLCPVCNSDGALIYNNLTCKLFNTPGLWNIKKCNRNGCETLWLDPTPREEDIPKLYTNYHTHYNNPYTPPKENKVRNLLEKIRSSYLHEKYGYKYTPLRKLEKIYTLLAYIHPAWRDTQEANLFYLPYKEDGILLDIGCGGGNNMDTMQKIGWQTIGIDFDVKAVDNAKNKGLDARSGDLFSQHFANESFDAIIMNHVIEHVPNPKKLMLESKRILKTGGTMTIMTPNTAGRGHRLFKQHWRGLEVPTHLQIFSVKSLLDLAKNCGFNKIKSFSSTQGILSLFDASKSMKETGNFELETKNNTTSKIIKQFRWFIFGWMHILFPGRDEVAVIICEK